MSALGVPVLINSDRSYWLSSIGADVIHSTIQVQEIDASVARISTLDAGIINASTVNISTLNFQNSDVSGMYVSSIRGNTAFFSTMTLASDLSGGVGFVRFSVDASGIQVDGDPIRFDNLVYLTSTINIIQVSTLVDTDIFAQNGYFSTISSLQNQFSSVQAGDLSGNIANIKQLTVSSLVAGDISGVALAEKWSLYPTLNSTIIFQPGFELSNVGSALYFAGVEITDVSGGGQDWSRFPALSTVTMNNNVLTGLSSILFNDNSSLYSLTSNNLFYNGNPIAYGTAGFASNWAQYPANCNVNLNSNVISGASLTQTSNLTVFGSNVTSGNTFTNSLGVGGLSALPIASITSGGDLNCRNIEVGDSTTSLADVNIYGVNAVPGDNALYVLGGTTLTGGLTGGVPVHGTEIGALPVAGIDTVRIDVLPVGMGLNSATYIQLAAAGAGSFAAGGALSLAGGDYVEINTDDLRVINTTSGNQSTTLTVANIQMPASVAASVPLQINNTAGGGINLVGTPGVGQIAGFSSISGNNIVSPFLSTTNINLSTINGVPLSSIQTPANIVCSNINVAQSTITQTLYNPGSAFMGFAAWNNALGISTTIGALRTNNIQIPDNITGITNAPAPLQSRIENFSSIQSGTISTINLVCSTINGAPPGGGGGGGNVFSTLQASTLFGEPNNPYGSSIAVAAGLQFVGGSPSSTANGRWLSSLNFINDVGTSLTVEASTMFLSYTGGINPNGYIRLGSGGAFDTVIKNYNGEPALSTGAVLTSSIVSPGFLDISGGVNPSGPVYISLSNAVQFADGSLANYSQFEYRDVAANSMLSITNTPGLGSNNMERLGVGEIWITGGADQYGAVRIYSEFPYGNLGIDVIRPDGATLFEAYNLYDTGGENYQANLTVVSSITGYTPNTPPGGESAVGFDNLITVPKISTLAIQVSSIVGNDARPAYTNLIQFSTMELFAGSTTLLCFSTPTTSSNINSTDYDVVVGLNGTFKIGTSIQLLSGGAADEVEYFFLKNDTIIPNAGGIVSVGNNDEFLTYCEIIEPLNNGDKIQVGCYTSNAGVYLSTVQGALLQSPAGILTMYKVN